MNSTVKTVLIIAGVGLGVYVVLQLVAPKQLTMGGAKSNTSTVSVGGLLGSLGSFIGGLASGSSSGGGGGSSSTIISTTDSAAQQDYATSHGVVDLEGNQLVDLNTGNALTYGTN